MNRELLRAMTAEAIGTFALVFAGCGAITRPADLQADVDQSEQVA